MTNEKQRKLRSMSAEVMEDEKIIELFFARDERAISETRKKYNNYCYQIAYNILYNNEDCNECVNSTWLRTWQAIPPQKPGHFSAYLGKITRNIALNVYEKMHRSKRGGGQVDVVYEELEEVVAGSNSPQEQVELELLTSCINSYLETIPKINRLVFVGRYWRLESIEGISKHLGISQSKTKTLLFRTRNGLKEYLIKEGFAL